jgi:hypothetical protein
LSISSSAGSVSFPPFLVLNILKYYNGDYAVEVIEMHLQRFDISLNLAI